MRKKILTVFLKHGVKAGPR